MGPAVIKLMFLCQALAVLLEEKGMTTEANLIVGLTKQAANDQGADLSTAEALLTRFRKGDTDTDSAPPEQ